METEQNCIHCTNLKLDLAEKEREIQRLKLHIKKLTKLLLDYKINGSTNLNLSFEDNKTGEIEFINSKINESPLNVSACDLIDLSCDILNIKKQSVLESKFVQTDDPEPLSNLGNIDDENYENSCTKDGNLHDYVYDKNYQMYYNYSTGYYYDEKSGLMYEPQSCTYYRYNYEKKEYEKVSSQDPLDETSGYLCETVLDQVNNLNLNDESINGGKSESKIQNSTPTMPESCIKENESPESTDQEKIEETEVSIGSAKDWQPVEGCKLTVADMVKQVIDEHDNMSDYVYNETYQMYYSASTGYFFDSIRKLLYDPSSGIYYFYDADKQTYEFYCHAVPNASNEEKSSTTNVDNENLKKLARRKRYWKKKLEHIDKSPAPDIAKPSVNCNGDDLEESEEFSSPEDGEIFSSDDDSSPLISIVKPPVEGCVSSNQKYDFCPPSIRAIVENSEKLKIGSLILITCTGGIVGRDKINAICLPDICVSKAHAEIKYNSEFQTYYIEDLGSQNGTFINEKRLSEPKVKSEPSALKHGDKLSFGSCKLLLHIHEGTETCDGCEPGQVLAEICSNAAQAAVFMTKEEKEKQRRQELYRLKKKYGLKGSNFENKKTAISEGYEDKAEIRRQTVGSDNPYEKTQEASVDCSMPETNKGYQMLKKMGWKEGETLGTADTGLVEPILLRPWTSKAGLGSASLSLGVASNPEDRRAKSVLEGQSIQDGRECRAEGLELTKEARVSPDVILLQP